MGLKDKWKSEDKNSDEIPMAAMPDIAFLLLVFFMVSTTFLVTRTLDVELPAYSSERQRKTETHVNVALSSDSVRVDYADETVRLELWELEGYVRDALASAKSDSEKVVMLEVQDECSYQRVVDAFDAIQTAGGFVSLVEPETQNL